MSGLLTRFTLGLTLLLPALASVPASRAAPLVPDKVCQVIADAWTRGSYERLSAIPDALINSLDRREAQVIESDDPTSLGTAGYLVGAVQVGARKSLAAVEVERGGSCHSGDIVLGTHQPSDGARRYLAAVSDDDSNEAFTDAYMGTSAHLVRVDARLFKLRGDFHGPGLGGTPYSLRELKGNKWVPRCTFRAVERFRVVGIHPACRALESGSIRVSELKWWMHEGRDVASVVLSAASTDAGDAELLAHRHYHSGGCGGTRTWAYFRDEFEGRSREEITQAVSISHQSKTVDLLLQPELRNPLSRRGAIEDLIDHYMRPYPPSGARWPQASTWQMDFVAVGGLSAVITDSAEKPRTVSGVTYDRQLVLNGRNGPQVVCHARAWPRIQVDRVFE